MKYYIIKHIRLSLYSSSTFKIAMRITMKKKVEEKERTGAP